MVIDALVDQAIAYQSIRPNPRSADQRLQPVAGSFQAGGGNPVDVVADQSSPERLTSIRRTAADVRPAGQGLCPDPPGRATTAGQGRDRMTRGPDAIVPLLPTVIDRDFLETLEEGVNIAKLRP